MKIEKLQLTGFKSFAERTVFTFHPGITCIVGPNGCGKSNIVDAFRWVLGEQSARILRGDKMEEVIFNGSQTKKARGMAEVVLHISLPEEQGNGDNGGRTITVSRRLYRSGESEYLINRRICRLKDIREMFLDTGLEMRSYSILEQGRIGEIINAKPLERRFLIEEVAGIMKYKVRKAEAQNKLESSRLNLQRIDDIISEVKRQLNSLNRQAKKAQRYKQYMDSLREIELRVSKRKYVVSEKKLGEIRAELDLLTAGEVEKTVAITERENAIQQERIEIVQREGEIDKVVERLQEMERGISFHEQRGAVHRRDLEHLEGQIGSLTEQVEEIKAERGGKQDRLTELSGKDTLLKTTIDSLSESILQQEADLTILEEDLESLERDIDDRRKELFALTDSLGLLKNELGRFEVRHEEMQKKASGVGREKEEAERRAEELSLEIEGVLGEISAKREGFQDLHGRRRGLNDEMSRCMDRLEELRKKKSELREEIASLDSRMASLQEMVRGSIDVERFRQEGVHLLSLLSEVIEVEEEYERAVEAALSEKIMGFIVSTRDDIMKSVSLVREHDLPRTAILLSEGSDAVLRDIPAFDGEGAVPLHEVLKESNRHFPLLSALLRNYVLVDDLDAAYRLFDGRALPEDMKVVTRDGEVLERDSVVLCGSGSGILRLRREIRDIAETIDAKRSDLGETDSEITGVEAQMEEVRESLKVVEAEIVSLEKEISGLEASERRLEEERDRFRKKGEFLGIELEELEREIEELQRNADGKREEVRVMQDKRDGVEEQLAVFQEDIALKRVDVDSRRQAINDIKVEIHGYSERLRSMERERTGLRNEIEAFDRKESQAVEMIKIRGEEISEKRRGIEEVEGRLRGMVVEADSLRKEITQRRDAIRLRKETLIAEEEKITRLRKELGEISRKIHERDLLRTELSIGISSLVKGLSEKYGVDIREEDVPLDGFDGEEDKTAADELVEKIDAMGPVNLGALEEHSELTERYEFLKSQYDDIVSSIEELREAITRINKTTRKMLGDAFDSLRTKFNEVFKLLFGGGFAELRLTEENNILESGIDIVVQPPGKKLQNLNLLSGGEKALTAVSLLFAGFLLKPSPLCILDEADAPLDESNTVRFRELLRELARNIQFIVITHNKITMEGTDYLYGITMVEPGVSNVLSMEFV